MSPAEDLRIGPRVERETVGLSYDGPDLSEGSMDAKDLGPVLVSVADLCYRANYLINGNEATLSVRVQAQFQRGSFDIPVEVVQTVAASLLSGDVKSVEYVLGTIGLGNASTAAQIGGSIWKFLKWAHGKIIVDKTPPQQNGMVTVKAGDGSSITVNQHVVVLANDPQARRALEGIVRPLEHPGVERVVIKDRDQVVEAATRDDVPALTAPLATQPTSEEQLSEEDREAVVEVIKAAFKDNMAWEFSEGGTTHFPAVIADEDFLRKVQAHEFTFGTGDILRVRLVTKKFRTATGLRSDVRAVRVIEIIPAPRQGSLPL